MNTGNPAQAAPGPGHPPTSHSSTSPDSAPAPLKPRWMIAPVFWAGLGVVCLLAQAWVFARWAADGNFHAYPSGGYEMPRALKISTMTLEVVVAVAIIAAAVLLWWLSRKAGHVTLYTALFAGYMLCFWTNPYSGAVHHAAGHNRYSLNVVSWGSYLPGWHGPLPQIESFVLNASYPVSLIWAVIGVAVAERLRRWRPSWSRARVATLTALIIFFVDIPLETAYMRPGGWAYPRALPYLTLFEDSWYRIPLTSPFTMVVFVTMPVVLMYLYAKPGNEVWLLEGSLQLPQRVRTPIRLLAGIGFINLSMMAFQWFMVLASLVSYPAGLPSWIDRPHT
ncbi:spirocyclase AveC family protein [Streptomyces himalayensis]|uniref:Spirocyclase AveC family protein n=1 Tax=Streptomyces himalayensis subsp. himalayensis TaxID=2756131 RepID=A0A7W0DV34_9ACTN|nr:spirocyclase AveC family protein [Streptomyces himalayensis]MBA2951794.1 spirocyclase AveC family protein [Streptomyces himalayensis subsp. himalayensis]